LVDGTVEYYGRSLEWVLRRQTMTLLVTFGTLVATIWLYVIMPKGFLPSQDTGLIFAVSEAGAEVSFAQMQRLQADVEAAIKKDPDVAGLVSVLGVSRMNPTPNAGRLAITLRPRDERRASADDIVGRLKRAVAPIPGMTVYFQPVQDIQISTRPSRAQYQYTLVGTDAGDVLGWSEKVGRYTDVTMHPSDDDDFEHDDDDDDEADSDEDEEEPETWQVALSGVLRK